jgi:hypothetical protein
LWLADWGQGIPGQYDIEKVERRKASGAELSTYKEAVLTNSIPTIGSIYQRELIEEFKSAQLERTKNGSDPFGLDLISETLLLEEGKGKQSSKRKSVLESPSKLLGRAAKIIRRGR